jgi:hypothetical protein
MPGLNAVWQETHVTPEIEFDFLEDWAKAGS